MLLKTKLNNVNSRSLIKMLTVCPSLVVTTTVMRSFIMGLTLTVVLLMSEVIVSLFRKLIPLNLRDLVYIMVSAFSASLTEILLNMWLPAAVQSLGVYLPILSVSCIVLMRVECCAAQNSVGASLTDAAICGGEFSLIMVGAGFIRELFGTGRLFALPGADSGLTVFPAAPFPILQSTAGVLLMAALGAGFAKYIKNRRSKRSADSAETV